MLNSFLKKSYLLGFVFIASCQPIKYLPLDSSQIENFSHKAPVNFNKTPLPNFTLPHQKEFKERFLSDKLDLVFVLDTSPNMKNFYQKNLFGPEFLNKLEKYDWKLAYTDMSVDINQFKQNKKEEQTENLEKNSCNFIGGVGFTLLATFANLPYLFGMGLSQLGDCFSSSDYEEKKTENFTNGSFLPFEYKGKKIKSNQLTKSVQNYNLIFDHSFRLGNEKVKRSNNYDAPEQRGTEVYPFTSMVLSLAKGISATDTKNQKESSPAFFRKDSAIVYVLVTTQDFQMSIPAEKFKKDIASSFGSEDRMKIIPITLSSNSSTFCNVNFENKNNKSIKMKEFSKKLGQDSLDICSQNLANELFNEISKSLYPVNFLNE